MNQWLQLLLPVLIGAWAGYVFGGRKWRREERRTTYRDYLLSAHRFMEAYWRFCRVWDNSPEQLPEEKWQELDILLNELKLKAQDVRLIAPIRVYGAADSIWVSADELFHEMIPNPETKDYDFVTPPSYKWFSDRRERFGWGPDAGDLDEFINEARVDLGTNSRFWRIRGDSVSYRAALPGWLKYNVAPRLPLVGRKIHARQMREFEASEAEALNIPLRDPYTGRVIPVDNPKDT